jgi:hypothetical protein
MVSLGLNFLIQKATRGCHRSLYGRKQEMLPQAGWFLQ